MSLVHNQPQPTSRKDNIMAAAADKATPEVTNDKEIPAKSWMNSLKAAAWVALGIGLGAGGMALANRGKKEAQPQLSQ